MTDQGVFVLWLHAYELDNEAFLMMVETFASVFPEFSMWNPMTEDIMLMGSRGGTKAEPALMRERFAQPAVQKDLQGIGIADLLSVLAMQMSPVGPRLTPSPGKGLIHSDYFPRLDYIAPRGFFTGNSAKAARFYDRRSMSPATAGLPVTLYLKEYAPSSEAFASAVSLARTSSSLYQDLPFSLATEWARRYPDDVNAQRAVAMEDRRRSQQVLTALADDASRVRLFDVYRYENYERERSAIALPEIVDLENDLRNRLNLTDPHSLMRRAQIAYDRASYEAARRDLAVLHGLPFFDKLPPELRLEAGLLYAECLLEQRQPREAFELARLKLTPFIADPRVPMMAGRIQRVLQELGYGLPAP